MSEPKVERQTLAEQEANQVQTVAVRRYEDGSLSLTVTADITSRSDLTQFAALLLAIGNDLFPVSESVSSETAGNGASANKG